MCCWQDLTRYLVVSRNSEPLPLLQTVKKQKRLQNIAKCCKYPSCSRKSLQLAAQNSKSVIMKGSGSNTNLGDNALLYEAPSTGITINVFDNHRAFWILIWMIFFCYCWNLGYKPVVLSGGGEANALGALQIRGVRGIRSIRRIPNILRNPVASVHLDT